MMTKKDYTVAMKRLTQESLICYKECEICFGEDFDSLMAELCRDIVDIQYHGDGEILSFGTASLILLNLVSDQPPSVRVGIKSAFCWHAFEVNNIEKILKQLQ